MTFYTHEIDNRIRAAFSLPRHSKAKADAIRILAEELGRTSDAIRQRAAALEVQAGRPVMPRRPFTAAEDAEILAIGVRPSAARWTALGEKLNRPVNSMRHRRAYLLKERNKPQQPHKPRRRPDRSTRFRVPLPVSTPTWFEHQITRDRLMAGR